MTRTLPLILMLLSSPLVACSSSGDEAAVRDLFKRFQDGLKNGDGDALWSVTDDVTKRYFNEFASSIRATCGLVRDSYPADDRATTLNAIGCNLEASAREGRNLFVYMLDPRKLGLPENHDSTIIAKASIEGDTATVVTRSDEVVLFTRNSDGTWGTRMFLSAFKDLPAVMTLRDNIRIVQENCRLLGVNVEAALEKK